MCQKISGCSHIEKLQLSKVLSFGPTLQLIDFVVPRRAKSLFPQANLTLGFVVLSLGCSQNRSHLLSEGCRPVSSVIAYENEPLQVPWIIHSFGKRHETMCPPFVGRGLQPRSDSAGERRCRCRCRRRCRCRSRSCSRGRRYRRVDIEPLSDISCPSS